MTWHTNCRERAASPSTEPQPLHQASQPSPQRAAASSPIPISVPPSEHEAKMDKRLLSREDEAATDTQVTRADQDRINRFSTLHQKQGLLREELEAKHQEKEYLTDVTSELELADEDELVPYKIGDSFLHLPLEEVQQLLEKSTERIEKEIGAIEERISKHRETMEELKVELYAKFGKAINLDV